MSAAPERPRTVELIPCLAALLTTVMAAPAATAGPAAPPSSAPTVTVEGSPRTIALGKSTMPAVDPNTGLTFGVNGPAFLLIEIRTATPTPRATFTLTRNERYASKNVLKFRRVGGGGREGYHFATVLSVAVPPGDQSYRIMAYGTEVAVSFTTTKKFLRAFAAAREVDTNPSAAVAKVEAPPEPTVKTPVVETPPSPLETTESPVAASGSADSPWGDGFDEAMTSENATERLVAAEEVLDIGGMIYLRGRASVPKRVSADTATLASPNLADVYLDATPHEQVRGFVKGRLNYNPTAKDAKSQATMSVNQLWLKLDIAHTLFVTFGKQPIKWGTGRFHNPTDFLNTERRDPFTLIDERSGVPLLKLHLPIESLNWNLYAISEFTNAPAVENMVGALRAEFVAGQAELSLTAVAQRNARPRFGADFSASLPVVDVFVEAALQQGGLRRFWRGDLDVAQSIVPNAYQRRETWLPQVAGGLEASIRYSEEDRLVIGAEYFYNAMGYRDGSLYPWLMLNDDYLPYYAGQQYAAGYIQLPSPGSLENTSFLLNTLGNLNDRSWLSWIEIRHSVLNILTLTGAVSVHWGRRGEFRLAADVPANPAVGVDRPLSFRPPFVDVMLGMLLNI